VIGSHNASDTAVEEQVVADNDRDYDINELVTETIQHMAQSSDHSYA
jgi:hypothetical protein